MVAVEVKVAEGMDKLTGLVAADLGDHQGEQGVGCDVEGNSEKKVGAALVELAGESGTGGVDVVDIELEQHMAGGQGHLIDFADVPCRDEMAA